MGRYRFAMPQVIDLKSVLAHQPFPSAGPSSSQGNEIQVKFINIGNLTVGIDILEVRFKLDLMPSGSEMCQLLNIDPNKAYSVEFSFYNSFQAVDESYAIRRSLWNSALIPCWDNSYYLYDGMTIDTRPLMAVREDYKQIDRYPYYIPSLQQFETILG